MGLKRTITEKSGHAPVINISPLRLEAGQKGEEGYSEFEVPASPEFGLEGSIAARNVAGLYRLMAQDLRHGTRTAPGFDNAVTLHRTLYAIAQSAETGRRVLVA
jgi:predicted dehydrogenase